jgi:hypothetical protein
LQQIERLDIRKQELSIDILSFAFFRYRNLTAFCLLKVVRKWKNYYPKIVEAPNKKSIQQADAPLPLLLFLAVRACLWSYF